MLCITSNDRPFGCPIIYAAFINNANLLIDTSDNACYNQSHWLIGMPYLLIIASNVYINCKGKSFESENNIQRSLTTSVIVAGYGLYHTQATPPLCLHMHIREGSSD